MQNNDKPPRQIYNPDEEDITTDFDKLGDNPQTFTLKAGEIKEFPEHIAVLLEEKLATRMLWKSLPANHNKEKRYNELLDLIRVK